MSASDIGYRRLAAWFNSNGWSVAFPHLPYHYSRTPRRTWNGELAITADLVRNAEGIRQGVIELRQLMALLRTRGTREFAIVGTSYGGWTGALLSFLEADFRFVALVQPIVNMDKAVWESPGSAVMRRELRRRGHSRGNTARFDHLVSPLHGVPLSDPSSIILTGGLHDRISPLADLKLLQSRWPGSSLLQVTQGHFGYAALRETMKMIESRIVG
jgi:pimeloyl-ACP methyl ester carboxylesterase